MSAVTFPSEFRDVQACYPIVFRKTVDGLGFEPIALFGFEDGKTCSSRASAGTPYMPMMVERQPFLIGAQATSHDQHRPRHPRVSQHEGEALFLPHGGNTNSLRTDNSMLLAIHQGLQGMPFHCRAANTNCWKALCSTSNSDGSQNRLVGFTPSTKTACKPAGRGTKA
jgi:hypothetical protein